MLFQTEFTNPGLFAQPAWEVYEYPLDDQEKETFVNWKKVDYFALLGTDIPGRNGKQRHHEDLS